jgi:hypothetical protein
MRVMIVQFYTKNVSYGRFSEEINRRYCQEHGYEYYVEKDDEKIRKIIEDRAFTWAKPKILLEAMEKHDVDYILFLDIDAIVSNNQIKIEEFIDENYEMVVTEDYSSHSVMNAGVILVKNSDWSKQFMKDWWDCGENLAGSDVPGLGGDDPQKGFFKQRLWHDQTCFTYLYKNNKLENNIKIITHRSLNWRDFNENNFIFHAFGYGHIRNRKIDTAYYKIFNIKIDPDNKSLLEISDFYPTDKESEHNYISNHYERIFEPLRKSTKRLCEIGRGCLGSAEMFRDYFVNAEIIACVPCEIKENKDRIKIELINQSNIDEIEEFCSNQENFDIILDDGSHKMKDQQVAFSKLFKKLNPGGIYIIEDLHTSVEAKMPEKRVFGWGDPEKTTTLEMLENFIKNKIIYSDYIEKDDLEYLQENIEFCEILKRNENYWSITSVIKKKEKEKEKEKINRCRAKSKNYLNEKLFEKQKQKLVNKIIGKI